ncbi:MAG: 4-coumarate--CoA ligase [Herminiimonas sp.]|nr:4-coumarate--CoA ligase [Herminiimonas sp.]
MLHAHYADNSCAGEWWDDDHVVRRFVCDLIVAELAHLRPSGVTLPALPWGDGCSISLDLGADSLELLGLASALAEAVHLHESGIEDYLLTRTTVGDWIAVVRAGLRQFSSALTFRTSGTGGQPKSCSHLLADLWQETLELAAILPRRSRILSAVPSHHIYGFLFTILLPRAMQLNGASVTDLRGSTPVHLARDLREGDLVIAHPEYWRAVSRFVPAIVPGVTGVTSTAPCADEVSNAVCRIGLDRLLQIYGSSETAGVGWRDSAANNYRLFSHWHRSMSDANELIRVTSESRHTLFRCQDVLAWSDENHFLPTGRIDDVVQVGGINVAPTKVRAVLLRHPDVLEASVRLMHADEGNRLKAFVVPCSSAPGHEVLHQRLEQWVSAHLTPAERPKAFTFGAHLPVGPTGKDADWQILGTGTVIQPNMI